MQEPGPGCSGLAQSALTRACGAPGATASVAEAKTTFWFGFAPQAHRLSDDPKRPVVYHPLMRLLLLVVSSLVACRERPVSAAFDASALPPKVVNVVVTGPGESWLVHDGPRLIEHWRTQAGWPDALVLSTGVSASLGADGLPLFEGAATAAMMKAANVSAFTAGPRDVDFGAEALVSLGAQSGAMLLLTNVRTSVGAPPTFAMFDRGGVKVAVLGVSSLGKGDGPFEAVPLEGAVQTTLDAAVAQKAQVVVVLVNGCSTALRPLLEAHRDWPIDLVVASPCEGARDERVGATSLLHVKAGQYASLRAEFGGVRSLAAQVVDAPPDGKAEPRAAKVREAWLAKLAEERARPVAFFKTAPEPAQVALLVAAALRDGAKADAALFSVASLRGPLSAGALSRGAVLEVLPAFERVFLVDVPGEVLTKLVSHPDAFLSLPAKVDPNGSYVLATTELLYRVGIGLEAVDANPLDADVLLPTTVLRWLEAKGSSEKAPLALPPLPKRRR